MVAIIWSWVGIIVLALICVARFSCIVMSFLSNGMKSQVILYLELLQKTS
jgi:hypothetical protein